MEKRTVVYNKENGNVLFSTSDVPNIENYIIKTFEAGEGQNIVSVDVSGKEHTVVCQDNPISETVKLKKELEDAKKDLSTLQGAVVELTNSVMSGDGE